jgi:hypothetical protein
MIQDYNACQQIRSKTDGVPVLTEQLRRHPDVVYSYQRIEQTDTHFNNIADDSDHALDSHNTVWFCKGISICAVVFGICMNGRRRCDDAGEGRGGWRHVRSLLGEGSILIYICR